MARRPRPKVVSLTDAAAARVREVMADKGTGFLRVGVKNAGCAGMEYTMSYAEAPEALDEHVSDNGVEIIIDGKAVLFLLGSDDRLRDDGPSFEVRLPQPQPDRRLRLWGKRDHRAGCGRVVRSSIILASASRRDALVCAHAAFTGLYRFRPGVARRLWPGPCETHVRRRGDFPRRRRLSAFSVTIRVFLKADPDFGAELKSQG